MRRRSPHSHAVATLCAASLFVHCSRFEPDLSVPSDRDAGAEASLGEASTQPEPDGGEGPLDAGGVTCPLDMVSGGGFCIDRTETTEASYKRFLADAGPDAGPIRGCEGLATPSPGSTRGPVRPVTNVNWCDAARFCRSVGKRLCEEGEWQKACTADGARLYPYGSTFDGLACNTGFRDAGRPDDVGTSFGCYGGLPELADMTGNVDEWVATCIGLEGATDRCVTRGGEYTDLVPENLNCTFAPRRDRAYSSAIVGFRCCK